MEQKNFQLDLPEAEIRALANTVLMDYRAALADHGRRIARFREYYRRWRTTVDMPWLGEEAASNYPLPLIQWNCWQKWAKDMDALIGDDAQIVADAVGPAKMDRARKVGAYMTWRFFKSMRAMAELAHFTLNRILYGRAVAYRPWERTTFRVPGEEEPIVDYEGPGFHTLWPDEIIVPAEDVKSIHDFSFVVRAYRVTPNDMLTGEREGRYQGIRKNFTAITQLAQHGTRREPWGEEIKREKDDREGVTYEHPLSSGEIVFVLEWYGKYRRLKNKSAAGAPQTDFSAREMEQSEICVRYLLDLDMVVGVQDLGELYPKMRHRRPFTEASLCKDGTYWGMGLAEMLIDSEDELRANHNQMTEAIQLAISPMFGYRPASGFQPTQFKVAPATAVPLDNPQTDVRQITTVVDIRLPTVKEQMVVGYVERLTGQTDMSMGRQSDRPNQPRTAKQTSDLLEEGNVRLQLDQNMLREDMSIVLGDLWELEYNFADEETFFKVTEEEAGGLFDVKDGGSVLTFEERDGRYDFTIKFATSLLSREMEKQTALALYQLDMQNPLVNQNPRALWEATRKAHKALGDPNFASCVPQPPEPDLPVDPKLEWSRILMGEDVHVNPQDNDQQHLIAHWKDIQEAQASTRQEDPEALQKLIAHYKQQMAQMQQKQITQAVLEKVAQAAQAAAQGGGQFPTFANGLFGGPPNVPAGNPAAVSPQPYGHAPRPEDQP